MSGIVPLDVWALRRFRSACEFEVWLESSLGAFSQSKMLSFFMRIKTSLNRLRVCAGWFEFFARTRQKVRFLKSFRSSGIATIIDCRLPPIQRGRANGYEDDDDEDDNDVDVDRRMTTTTMVMITTTATSTTMIMMMMMILMMMIRRFTFLSTLFDIWTIKWMAMIGSLKWNAFGRVTRYGERHAVMKFEGADMSLILKIRAQLFKANDVVS